MNNDVMIFAKNVAQKLAIFVRYTAIFVKFGSQHWYLRKKRQFFPGKIGKNRPKLRS
jgi:hypothetical protein